MKINKYIYIIAASLLLSGTMSCTDFLEEKVYTEYDPNAMLQDQSGIDALLAGAYARSRIIEYSSRNYTYLMNEFPTDIAFETGGGLERDAAPFINFIWAVDNSILNSFWGKMYEAIASANSVLNVTEGLQGISEENLKKIQGEARFIRAVSYYFLYNIFGTTPIIEIPKGASPDEIEQIGKSTPRANQKDFVKYLVADLTFAAENLPIEENPIGKATKGAALAVLTKLYMHEKDWDNVISTSQQVIDLNYYSLYDNYKKMFSIEGENNKEYIYRAPCIAQSGYHNNYMPHAFPPKNEKQGPNQESITLINMIRKRAKTDEISLNDYNSKEALRDFILAERGREFFSEGLRREDLIRHGKFISDAVARGKNAKPFHVLYPIPQRQREANSSLGQNPGYEGAE